jgi:hypothetical protein
MATMAGIIAATTTKIPTTGATIDDERRAERG